MADRIAIVKTHDNEPNDYTSNFVNTVKQELPS